MIFLFRNIIRTVKGHPKENLVILVNMIMCTMTVFVLIQNYYYLKNHFDLVYGNNQVASHYMIVMSDNDTESMYSDLLNHSPMYYVGQKVNIEIMNTPHLSMYYSTNTEILLDSFKDKNKLSNCSRNIEDEGEVIDVICVTENFAEVFNLSLMKGRFFDNSDCNSNDPNMPVPVILGNDYADSYEVGDIIEFEGDKAIVIGILNDNMYMSGYGTVEYLDRMIITNSPFLPRPFELSLDDYEKFKVCDCIYCDDPTIDVQKEINRITTENGYYTYQIQPIDGIEISDTKNISEKNVMLIGLLALIACFICTFSLSLVLYNRSFQDRSIFCIYLCCGIPLWKINLSIIVEMIGYLVVSFFPTWALSIIEYKNLMVPVWQIFLFSGIIVIVSLIPAFKINRNNNVDMLIRDRIV